MKINKVVVNVLKNSIHILAIVSIFIVILQLKQIENKTKLAMQNESNQEIKKEEKVAENTKEVKNGRETKEQVTSRNSSTKSRKAENVNQKIYTKIEDIKISKDMDLTIRTGVSKEDFKKIISNVKYDTSKFFYDNSDKIYDLCKEYQINEIFFCGLISVESGWNIASNHRRTHNYISLMTKKGLISYDSVEEGLIAAAKALHNNYLTEGGKFYHGKTLYGVKTKFCPASSTWVELVYGRMQQIMKSI